MSKKFAIPGCMIFQVRRCGSSSDLQLYQMGEEEEKVQWISSSPGWYALRNQPSRGLHLRRARAPKLPRQYSRQDGLVLR